MIGLVFSFFFFFFSAPLSSHEKTKRMSSFTSSAARSQLEIRGSHQFTHDDIQRMEGFLYDASNCKLHTIFPVDEIRELRAVVDAIIEILDQNVDYINGSVLEKMKELHTRIKSSIEYR